MNERTVVLQEAFDIQAYLATGVEHFMGDVLRATFKNPKESAFMVRFAGSVRAAAKKRAEAEKSGEHIPAFLICSITSRCNLHCAGCYSRCNNATVDSEPVGQLTGGEWQRIFEQAREIGISFVFLIGGEPLLRQDVIEAAAKMPDILFPIFTNGTYLDDAYFELFSQHRNLVPVMSLEGDAATTDARRGDGVYEKLMVNMAELKRRRLLFGVSITVTTENIQKIASEEYAKELGTLGCKAVFFIEYVPMDGGSRHLAPGEAEREYLKERISDLRKTYPEMVFISFPGDEKSSGGCLAAGRGFFHINSHGGAEPCPASPYSDVNIRNTSLREALKSPLFRALQSGEILMDEHDGGCVLYEKRRLLEAILAAENE